MKKNNAIILLSGGLDCTVALSQCMSKFDKITAITFDYGQASFSKEKKASKAICKFYKIEQKILKLDWLKELIKLNESKSDWIPNRNSVFINIAAAYLDSQDGGKIIIGANKEEATEFSDNSKEFIKSINKALEYSSQKDIEVIAPLIDKNKNEIVKLAIVNDCPLHLISSCYQNTKKHCGKCKSCKLLKNALEANNRPDLIKELFE